MKKAALIVGVLGIFAVYTIVLRNQHSSGQVSASNTPVSTSGVSNTSNTSGGTGSSSTSGSGSSTSTTTYKDGTYTGTSEDAFYGNVQISATISGGKITDVSFLSYPNDNPNSQDINSQATPLLKQEALKAQSANVDVISGATLTSQAFAKSLQSVLSQAKA